MRAIFFRPFLLSLIFAGLNCSAESSFTSLSGNRLFHGAIISKDTNAPNPSEMEGVKAILDQAHTETGIQPYYTIEKYLNEHEDSAFAASLHAHLGTAFREKGRYTLALTHWEKSWEQTKLIPSGEGKKIADYSLAHWTELLASLGRHELLAKIYSETKNRKVEAGATERMYSRAMSGFYGMMRSPDTSYKCGTYALENVGKLLTTNDLRKLSGIPSPETGFSMSTLVEIADQWGLDLAAVRFGETDKIVVPSVIHWRQNHYAAIVEQNGKFYRVIDPTFESSTWMEEASIKAEGSGYYLIPKSRIKGSEIALSKLETLKIFGKGRCSFFLDDNDDCTNPAGGGCPSCFKFAGESGSGSGSGSGPGSFDLRNAMAGGGTTQIGMAVWSVFEPFIEVNLADTPLYYRPSIGPEIAVNLRYKQKPQFDAQDVNFYGFGPSWFSDWSTYIVPSYYTPASAAELRRPGGGGNYSYITDGTTEMRRDHTRMTATMDGTGTLLLSYQLFFPDGSEKIYGYPTPTITAGLYPVPHEMFLTQIIDPQGHIVQFQYEEATNTDGIVRLKYVIDAQGGKNVISYNSTNAYSSNLISTITDPFGNAATFEYDALGMLTNITDVVQLTSSFLYDSSLLVTNLTTAYGTTSFGQTQVYGDQLGDSNAVNRAILVTEPTGGHHLYMYRDDSYGLVPTQITNGVPTVPGTMLETTNLNFYRNSFYWNPKQYESLSTTYSNNFIASDFTKGRVSHWLHSVGGGGLGSVLSLQTEPSPDGTTVGQITWYDYPGKIKQFEEGTLRTPSAIAKVMPDGSSSYQLYSYDSWGNTTNVISTFTKPDLTIGTRTNSFLYSTNGADLLASFNYSHEMVSSNVFDAYHNVRTNFNGVMDKTVYNYNANQLLSGILTPAGLTVTNFYDANAFLTQRVSLEIHATNSWTYFSNSMVKTFTDARGMTVTNTYDALLRLTSQYFPDNSYTSNKYYRLDLAGVKDRLTNWTYYRYNGIRQKVTETNALGNVWTWDYCTCGALTTMTDPLTNVTTFLYDQRSLLLKKTFPDTAYITNKYDLLGRLIKTADSSSRYQTNTYNQQGFTLSVSNNVGQIVKYLYDIEDRVTNSVNSAGVMVSTSYDLLGRPVIRSYPNSTSEGFLYTVQGLSVYTNQAGFKTYYGYDQALRKSSETNANSEVTYFTNSPAGDLIALVDGKSQKTYWTFDLYGRLSSKTNNSAVADFIYLYDSAGHQTNRWTPAKGNTAYSLDAVGNVTGIVYAASSPLTFGYDANNRLSTMLDGIGTSSWTYTSSGFPQTETGPWAQSTVSRTFSDRLIIGLSISSANTAPFTVSYAYDNIRRLTNLVSSAGTFNYGYFASTNANGASRQIKRFDYPVNSAFWTNQFDNMGRLKAKAIKSGTILDSWTYGFNERSERTNVVRVDGSYVNYSYDNIGQLKIAHGYESNTTARLNEQFGYNYDSAHNLAARTNNALVQSFSVDGLNQLSGRTRSGTLTVAGIASTVATNVTVNSANAAFYKDGTFAKDSFTLNNGNNSYTAIAQKNPSFTATDALTVNLPATGTFVYDSNGNLTSDGLRGFDYDDENQLIRVMVTGIWKTEFAYDGLSRKRIRKEFEWISGAWRQSSETRYVYDGKVVVQERDGNNVSRVSYTRGLDLANSLQNAGGIGGLIARTDHLAGSGAFYFSDGNGNVTLLISDLGLGEVVAKYSYDPYGYVIAKSGALAEANVYQFSSQEFHAKSGLISYLYRCYDPNPQRWLNKDPIEEVGGLNLYGFVGNNPLNRIDPFGLEGLDSPSASMNSAIARGDAQAIENLLESIGEDLSAGAREAAKAALKRLRSKCGDLVRGSLKRSRSYHSELEGKPYEELLKDSSKAAKQMRKLIEQSKRLMENN